MKKQDISVKVELNMFNSSKFRITGKLFCSGFEAVFSQFSVFAK